MTGALLNIDGKFIIIKEFHIISFVANSSFTISIVKTVSNSVG